MRRPTLIAILAAASLLGGCDRQKAADGQATPTAATVSAPPVAAQGSDKPAFRYVVDRSRRGTPASPAAFTAPDDAPGEASATLANFRGRPLLLNLWATWCAPCVVEMPLLDALAAEQTGRLTVLVVAQDLGGAAVVDPWFARANYRALQPYLDPDNRLLDAAGTGLPTTILYDAAGRELWRVVGAIDWNGAEARALLADGGV